MDNNYNNQNGYQQGEQFPQQNYPQGTYQQNYYQQNMYQQDMYQKPGNLDLENKATMAMVFGIIGLFFAGIIFGILALMNANECKKAGYSDSRVTAGFVLGILDIIALVIAVVVVVVLIAAGFFAAMR